jgi:hypothetical protein
VSKQFTATAVLLLQQEGELSFDDRLSRHVDGLLAWSDQLTLAQLMHHVSGIPETEDILLNKASSPKIVSSERRCERRSRPDPDNARQNSAWPDGRPARSSDTHEREKRRTPSLGAVSALQASMGFSIDTIELYERNMIDRLALRLVHGKLPVGS